MTLPGLRWVSSKRFDLFPRLIYVAEVCMENYDPAFASIAKQGDILVSGLSSPQP